MIQQAVTIIESQQQRSDHLAFLGVTKSAHDAIRSALALDLLHGIALTALVPNVQSLGNHAIKIGAGTLIPLAGLLEICCGGRESNLIRGLEISLYQLPNSFSPILQRPFQQRFPAGISQQIENNHQRRTFSSEFVDATCGWMNPLQQIIERKPAFHRNYEF